ncbi:MAG TPA: 4'-phosphopantetheinyl transferase superfamily protein [Desulfobacterales bacterium]|nr:4'-phosphopantetheinyl transferase superfamily protein [Desulfobacterales bacterium]
MQNSKKFPPSDGRASHKIAIQPLFSKTIISELPLFKGIKTAAFRLTISPQQANLAHRYLSPAEDRILRRFTFPKRAAQWLAGRLCAKAAALEVISASRPGFPAWRQIEINNQADGRPFITPRGTGLVPDISISHSGVQAAALAVWPFLCGLDIQEIRDTSRIKSRFASPEEEIMILRHGAGANQSSRAMFTMLWSIKEAVRKAFPLHPLPGFLDLNLQSLTTVPGGFSGRVACRRSDMPDNLSFFAFIENNYAAALTINRESGTTPDNFFD